MELKHLKAFSVLAEFGSFSHAAVILSVGQPVLSRQIKSLETTLGVQLLHRNGRGIVLTEEGKVLLQYAQGILETVSRAETEIAALRSVPTGRIVIGMPPSVGLVLTVPLVQRFKVEYPQIQLSVVEGFSGHLLEWLHAGTIDVAVLYNAPRMSNIAAEPLLEDELFLLGPNSNPANVPDGAVPGKLLGEIPLILPSRPHGLRLLIDQILGKSQINPNIWVEVDAMPSTLNLVEKGGGYTILSYSSVHHLLEAGRIRRWSIVSPQLWRQLILTTSTQRPTTTATRATASIVRSQVRELIKKGVWLPRSTKSLSLKPAKKKA